MQAWMVRAGSEGLREDLAREQDLALPGFTRLDVDLSSFNSQNEVRTRLKTLYGDSKNLYTLGSWAGQMWRFANSLTIGDIVVMPMKKEPGKFAIGRVSGKYKFDSNGDPGCRHMLPVKWNANLMLKEVLGPDLRASLGALGTVSLLSRHDAANRFECVLKNGKDLQGSFGTDSEVDEYLVGIVEQVRAGDHPRESVRNILARWGFYRRTARTVEKIVADLDSFGLLAVPAITDVGIEDQVSFVAEEDHDIEHVESGTELENEDVSQEQLNTAQKASHEASSGEVRYAVGSLSSASRPVETVKANTLLSLALTTMAVKAYSQLAVVDDENRLIGAITWESIAMAWASSQPRFVSDAMKEAHSVATSEELLSLTKQVSEHGYVFVRDSDGRVQGIVTASDLTEKFGDDQTPIIQLEEIERRLGAHVRAHCSDQELIDQGVRIFSSGKTLGTYVHVLTKPDLWEKLDWHGIERETFHTLMNQVRNIRNDIMHFSPDKISEEALETLKSAMRMLRLITQESEQD